MNVKLNSMKFSQPLTMVINIFLQKKKQNQLKHIFNCNFPFSLFSSFSCFTESDPEIERLLLQILSDSGLSLPINSVQLIERIKSRRFKPVSLNTLSYFLQKFATQSYITYVKNIPHGRNQSSGSHDFNCNLFYFVVLKKQQLVIEMDMKFTWWTILVFNHYTVSFTRTMK